MRNGSFGGGVLACLLPVVLYFELEVELEFDWGWEVDSRRAREEAVARAKLGTYPSCALEWVLGIVVFGGSK